MKKIKLIMMLMVGILAFTAWSCSDDDHDELIPSANQLPSAAQTFLMNYFGDMQITRIELDKEHGQTVYDVKTANGHEVTFDIDGEWIKVEAPGGMSIPYGIAPFNIENYINVTYPGAGINEISKTSYGYEVETTNNKDLKFDPAGNYIGRK